MRDHADTLRRASRFEGTLFVAKETRGRGQLVDRQTACQLDDDGLAELYQGAEGQRDFIRLTDEGRQLLEEG